MTAAEPGSEVVTYSLVDGVATIVMDDGKLNVFRTSMLNAVLEALDRAEADGALVVLAGRDGVFSAGFDVKALSAGEDAAIEMLALGRVLLKRLLSFPAPIAIACTGHALAMGALVTLTGDYRIGADVPAKVGLNEVMAGLTLPTVAVELARFRLAPTHFVRATDVGEIFTPATSIAAGYLDEVVPSDEVIAAAQRWAASISGINLRSHLRTKLRTRAPLLEVIEAALHLDPIAEIL